MRPFLGSDGGSVRCIPNPECRLSTEVFNVSRVSRGTKAFSAYTNSGYPGAFPSGFLAWVRDRGFWGDRRMYLCCGAVVDDEADRLDIQGQIADAVPGRKGRNATTTRSRTLKTTANIIGDARQTGLKDDIYDWVMVDPPYSVALAESMYGTQQAYSDIDVFLNEGMRITAPGGLLCSLTYQVPKKPPGSDLLACWGIYTIPSVRHLTCFAVFQKFGSSRAMGLQPWMDDL